MIVTIDWRMQTTGMWSDIFLPVAHHYEKVTFHIPTPHLLNLTFSDKAAEPPGDTKPEAEIVFLLAKKVEERAKARGLEEYTDNQGNARRLDGLYNALTLGGRLTEPEDVGDEWVRDSVLTGALPEGTTLETLKEKGYVRFVDWGISAIALNQASPLKPDETSHGDPPRSVLHRPRLVPGGRRGTAGAQGPPQGGRRLPLPDDQRPQPLEHPQHEHHQPHHAGHPPRPAAPGDEHRRRQGAEHRGQ
jgi:anaerobic selenocysteine-containing dehydrogenase